MYMDVCGLKGDSPNDLHCSKEVDGRKEVSEQYNILFGLVH